MDVDELYLDLLALRELYILLLKSFLRDANSELLDERAQILLKHLLDDATAGVLKFVSKNLATSSGSFYNFLLEDDKRTKPLDEKVVEWMKHNQTSASNVAIHDLSHGVTSALRRIEIHILSLQRCTRQRIKTKSHWQFALQGNEKSNQEKVQSKTDHSTFTTRFTGPVEGHYLSSSIGGPKVKRIVKHHCSEYVQGFNVEAMKPPTIETPISKQQKVVNPMTLMDKSVCTSVGSVSTVRSGMKRNQSRIQVKRSQNSYGQMVMGPTLLDHTSKASKEQTHNKATQEESEFATSEFESASSSSWTTQQTSESETIDDSSSPSHQDDLPTTSSETSSRYSSSISTRTSTINHGKKESNRSRGRFKRLKNKLGVIFHHHHHHHHHHHNGHNFMWKQLRKIFHHRDNNNKRLVGREDINEKVKKRAIRSVSHKNQVSQFQALAEGLRSHVWRSKGMKRKELRGLKCGKKMKKKGVKKLHWWKMFRHGRGVKLPNKGRMKIGYMNRKPQL